MSTEHTPEPEHAGEPGPDHGRAGGPGHPDGGRRRPGALVAAAVAAAVMLTGGGVAYLAAETGDGGSGADGSGSGGEPPPLRLDGFTAESAADGGGPPLRAVGELPDGPDEAAVYAARGRVDAADVARLAEALGVAGEPRMEGGSWRVGVSRDAQGPLLQVQPQAPGSWSFQRHAADCDTPQPVQPDGGAPDTPDGSDGSNGSDASLSAVECATASNPEPSDAQGDPVPADAAKEAAEPVLKALGQDDAEIAAAEPFGAVRTVTAEPVVGGLPTTGWQTSLQIGAEGQVTGGSGYLAEPAEGHTYPVITADEALKELNETRGGSGREDLAIAQDCASAVPYEKGTGPERPVAGKVDPCLGKVEPRKVRGAEFGLSAQSVDGQPALVPSWLFEVTGEAPTPLAGGVPGEIVWSQVAVDPEYIRPDEPGGTPTPEPAPPTSAPGSAPGSGSGSGSGPGGGDAGSGNGSQPGSPGQEEPAEPAPRPPSSAPAERPENGAERYDMTVESYSADGRTLTLHFWGGVCSDYSATADESGDTVKVQVTGVDKEPGQVCIKVAKRFTEKVELSSPLDGRAVVDAHSGKRVAAK